MTKTSRRIMALLVCFSSLGVLLAQMETGTILGTITDPSGAVVPRVQVTLRRVETNEAFVTETNDKGDYRAERLPVGNYVIQTVKSGFNTQERKGIKLDVARTIRVDLSVAVGQVTQRVEVTAAAPLLTSEKAQLAQVIDNKKLEGLPLNARDFTQMAVLSTGVAPARGSIYGANASFYTHGQRASANATYVDGTMFNVFNGNTPFSPSVDALQEFTVVTANYGAEYGLQPGAQVNAVLKSGGNTPHGNAFEFLRNDAFTARNFFERKVLPFKRNQFGGTLGGPIYIPHLINGKDKAWFFFSFQDVIQHQFRPLTGTVPTAAQRGGQFASTIIDPLTGQPFPGNMIPANRINPLSAQLMQFWPNPNTAGALNYTSQASVAMSTNPQEIVRIDVKTSERNAWSGKFINDVFPNVGLNAIPYFTNSQPAHHHMSSISNTRTFGGWFVNTARFEQVWRIASVGPTNQVAQKTAFMQTLAIPGVPNLPAAMNGIPTTTVTDYLSLGDTCCSGQDYFATWMASDGISMVRGHHSTKIGVQWRQYTQHVIEDTRPQFNFFARYTRNAFADFLLGYPASTGNEGTSSLYNLSHREYDFYVQDDWKVSQKLTLNLGVRYELKLPWADKRGLSRNFDPRTGGFFPTEVQETLQPWQTARYTPNYPLVTFPHDIFVPRLGLAYRVSPKTVVRAAYGMYTEEVIHRDGLRGVGLNPHTGDHGTINIYNAAINTPTISLSDPFPPALLGTAAPDIWGIETPSPTQVSHSWGISIQRALTPNLMLEIAYQGQHDTHIVDWNSLNDATPNTSANRQLFRPYPQWQFVQQIMYDGDAKYEGLELKVEKRATQDGIFLVGGFTWSHATSDIDNIGGGAGQNYRSRNVPPGTRYGNSGMDVRRRLMLMGGYQLPFGAGKAFLQKGLASKLVGGWDIQGIATVQDGPWFSAVIAGDPLNTGSVWSQRPDLVGNPNLSPSSRTRTAWFNTAAFAMPAALHYGNEGTGTLEGPGLINVDLGLHRTFFISERQKVEFRFEGFNAFNHTNFGLPANTFGTGSFGVIGSALDPRQLQFALKYLF